MTSASNNSGHGQAYESGKYSGNTGNSGNHGYPLGPESGYGAMSTMSRYPGYPDNITAAAKSEYSGIKNKMKIINCTLSVMHV